MAKSALTGTNRTAKSSPRCSRKPSAPAPASKAACSRAPSSRIENEFVLVDVGLKSEGRVALKEFAAPGQKPRSRSATSSKSISSAWKTSTAKPCSSREKARREEAWTQLEKQFKDNQRVTGVIFGRVKGGFTVDLDGAVAFLPGSQVDIRPVRDVGPLMGTPQPFQILKMDRAPRQHRRLAPRRARREPRRAAHRAGRQPQGRPGPDGRGQEHHRLRRVRRSRRRRRPAARHRHRVAARQPSERSAARSARPSRCRSSGSTRRPSASRSA